MSFSSNRGPGFFDLSQPSATATLPIHKKRGKGDIHDKDDSAMLMQEISKSVLAGDATTGTYQVHVWHHTHK